MISMTTDSVLPREVPEFWQLRQPSRTPMCIEPAGKQPLRGEVQARVIGDLRVAKSPGSECRFAHRRADRTRSRSPYAAACTLKARPDQRAAATDCLEEATSLHRQPAGVTSS